MTDLLNKYHLVRECIYKGEHYSVRDNGAIMRHPQEGKRLRKYDNVWTFGKTNATTGYMNHAGQGVHRIVACAFHGNPPTDQHIVDHIDTNRKNNRPENLRWLTRLENALNNPITRQKIELVCGSIEAFIANPAILRGHEHLNNNFSWMRTVSSEEAQTSYARLLKWAEQQHTPRGGQLGEWIYQDSNYINKQQSSQKVQSLTPNAVQLNWKTPVEFLCCPQQTADNPLETYMANLEEGYVFCQNEEIKSTILRYGMTDYQNLWVMCNVALGWKTHAITHITYIDGVYYHENVGVYDIGDEPEEVFDSILKGIKKVAAVL